MALAIDLHPSARRAGLMVADLVGAVPVARQGASVLAFLDHAGNDPLQSDIEGDGLDRVTLQNDANSFQRLDDFVTQRTNIDAVRVG